ncbi:formate dehydrogenase accessory sulfurtransferase FdhD [Beijerinckia indica]|uniref:Sulfur carrier protein FdhD n=1 Tax=Beijerinckia indica subsp. indica (strain ATCC 9039 / DSM 1715 / NCIMB 8712) TaxID=395963 RepID=B2II55_BEII9|nr:formate dehydrogenase accessory sulfurtransferase FdhD [Beijerinckia indica]ACB94638.1 formate dehydrogenase family accessory protein FdhD [Beijerinckia indica subsp. indica ATCC 9039]
MTVSSRDAQTDATLDSSSTDKGSHTSASIMAHWPALCVSTDGVNEENITLAIADETPISLIYNTIPYAVMMATAQDIEDFAIGFSLTEGIVSSYEAIREMTIQKTTAGYEVHLHIAGSDFQRLLQSGRRAMVGRTGCGICGAETADTLIKPLPTIAQGKRIALSALRRALEDLETRQSLNAVVHMVHGAAWVSPEAEILFVREDIGRHNALDKLIGAGLRNKIDFSEGFCLITSRCSYEMVQKAVMAGMPILVAISAPTIRALGVAEERGLTLVALARQRQQVIFTGASRIDLER